MLQTIATSLEQTTESRINEVLDNQYGKLLGLLINRKEAYLMVKQKGLQYLKKYRKKSSFTQQQLAKIKYLYFSLCKIENGFTKPSYEVIKRMKEFYGKDFDTNQLFK